MFDHEQADVRLAASIALGNVTVGNPNAFLDQVFNLINSENTKKYLFLSTLREIIIENPKCLVMHLERVVDLFMAHSTHQDENIRNIVAESLGRLTPAYEMDIFNVLEDGLKANDAKTRSTIAKSVKYSGPKLKEPIVFDTLVMALIQQQYE